MNDKVRAAISGSREPDPSFTGSGPAGFDPGRKWTPGPWKVFRSSNGNLLGIGDADAGGITDAYGGLWRDGKEMEANASLIAAAPELYAMLEIAVAVIDQAGVYWMGEDSARKVLRKARGETA